MFVSTVVNAGNYLIIVHDVGNNDFNEDTYRFCLGFTGIDDEALSAQFEVFPNPNNGNFYLRLLNNDIQITEISLYDPSGRLVKNYQGGMLKNEEISINTNTISKGFYLLKIMTSEGLVTRKIMVR